MFALTPVSALHSGYGHGHYRQSPRDRYLAALAEARAAEAEYAAALAQEEAIRRQHYQEALRRQREEAIIRRQRQEAIRRQTLLDAFRNPELNYIVADDDEDEDDAYDFAPRCRTNPYAAFAPVHRYPQHLASEEQQEWERRVAEAEARARRQEWERHAALQRARSQERREEAIRRSASRSPARPQPHVATEAQPARPLQERLESRLMSEGEQEIKDALASLLTSLNASQAQPSKPEEDVFVTTHVTEPKGKEKEEAVPVTIPISDPTPKEVAASLDAIRAINAEFDTLSAEFELPADLDFDSAPSTPVSVTSAASGSNLKLAFTARNAPVRFFEHALNGLLAKLDTIESFGDEHVRTQRKATVTRIEKALEEVEKEVGERFEAFMWKENHKSHATEVESKQEDEQASKVTAADVMEVEQQLVSDMSPEAVTLPIKNDDVEVMGAAAEDASLPSGAVSANVDEAAATPESSLPSHVFAENDALVSEPTEERVTKEVSVEEGDAATATVEVHEDDATPESDASTPMETEQTPAAAASITADDVANTQASLEVPSERSDADADFAIDAQDVHERAQETVEMVVETNPATIIDPSYLPDLYPPVDHTPSVPSESAVDIDASTAALASASNSNSTSDSDHDEDETMADAFLLPSSASDNPESSTTPTSSPSHHAQPGADEDEDDVVLVEDTPSSESSRDGVDSAHEQEDGWCEVDA